MPESIDSNTISFRNNTTVELLTNEEVYAKMSAAKNPFGDGYAAERIVEAIRYYFGLRKDRPEDY